MKQFVHLFEEVEQEGNNDAVAHAITVSMDSAKGETQKGITAWSFGDKWNGFECPSFEKEQADAVARDLGGKYDETSDSYKFPDEEDMYEPREIRTDDGVKKVWSIGAFGWTWLGPDMQ